MPQRFIAVAPMVVSLFLGLVLVDRLPRLRLMLKSDLVRDLRSKDRWRSFLATTPGETYRAQSSRTSSGFPRWAAPGTRGGTVGAR
jgi:hypothetical protein